jgi:tetraacyldisaccharide 4'-kinase
MSQSLKQKIRKELEYPFLKKSFLFWVLFPFLLFFSWTVFFVSQRRRINFYFKNFHQKNIKIICVGNILIGGTGKSPVVQKIAQLFLQKKWIVAIAARGVGKNIVPVFVKHGDGDEKLKFLSDENREHYELLYRSQDQNSIFYIFQNKKRLLSLNYFLAEIKKKSYDFQKCVLILDDGLQHFQCPRDIDLCLWSPTLLSQSPPFSLPLGPYREGFGRKSFAQLLKKFHFRLWSRCREEDVVEFKKNILRTLKRYHVALNESDFLVVYKTIFWETKIFEDHVTLVGQISLDIAKEKIKSHHMNTVITGIAHPENFIIDLKKFFKNYEFFTLFLDDHGEFSKKAILLAQNSQNIIMSLKDFLRWHQEKYFFDAVKSRAVFVCSVEVDFLNFSQNLKDKIHVLDFF